MLNSVLQDRLSRVDCLEDVVLLWSANKFQGGAQVNHFKGIHNGE